MKKSSIGLVQVYTGDGKGKTTAALGIAFRASGHGLKTYMIQFMKGEIFYGELGAAKKLSDTFTIKQMGRPDFVDKKDPDSIDIKMAGDALELSKKVILSGDYDLVILDEINVALDFGLIKIADVIEIIKSKPPELEIILTGRYAPKEIIEMADLVTEMMEIKHPYNAGVEARIGIER
jgi:cob(I)alamin adenosyltransferase